MAKDYDSIDLWFTDEGDFSLDGQGDIRDTSSNLLRSIEQELRTRFKSAEGDWLSDPHLGADLLDFVGEPNTKALAQEIALQLQMSVSFDNLVAASDLEIIPMPLDVHTIIFRVTLRVSTLTNTNKITVNIAYDTLTGGPIVL